MKAALFLAILTVTACAGVNPAQPSTSTRVVQQAAPPTPQPTPAPAAPAPTPSIAPCSVLQPPPSGQATLLLCVTGDSGQTAIEHAKIEYGGQFVGYSDGDGQFLLSLRGYGGTQPLVVSHDEWSNSPVYVDLQLKEEHVSEAIDLGLRRNRSASDR